MLKRFFRGRREPARRQSPVLDPRFRFRKGPKETLTDFHERLWSELDPEVSSALVATLAWGLPTETLAWVQTQFAALGDDWPSSDETSEAEREEIQGFYIPSPFHFGAGMAIRNLLREEVGPDRILPSGNYDDYYIAAVERAAGVR